MRAFVTIALLSAASLAYAAPGAAKVDLSLSRGSSSASLGGFGAPGLSGRGSLGAGPIGGFAPSALPGLSGGSSGVASSGPLRQSAGPGVSGVAGRVGSGYWPGGFGGFGYGYPIGFGGYYPGYYGYQPYGFGDYGFGDYGYGGFDGFYGGPGFGYYGPGSWSWGVGGAGQNSLRSSSQIRAVRSSSASASSSRSSSGASSQ